VAAHLATTGPKHTRRAGPGRPGHTPLPLAAPIRPPPRQTPTGRLPIGPPARLPLPP